MTPRFFALTTSLLAALFFATCMQAQTSNSVGVLSQTAQSYDGYTLLPVSALTTTYLINNCGEQVHQWESAYKAGLMAYLMPNGDLIRAGKIDNSVFTAGGTGGILERFNWDGDLEWSMQLSSDTACQHHDFAVMPNGHILALLWRSYPGERWVSEGRDPALTSQNVWGTWIVEIDPEAPQEEAIVWSWEAIDHLVQSFDPDRPSFGSPDQHPGKLNVNYQAFADDPDWLHVNSVAYHQELDQIMISSRDFSEIWILDHSVPTELASTDAGDLLYRWGNPASYNRGTLDDQAWFNQHDARWLDDGRIMVFSNGNDRPAGLFSSVEIINPPLTANGTYTLDDDNPWGPMGADWVYPATLDASFFSQNTSGAQQLPNGNILITEGASGDVREVTVDHEIVWRYVNPMGTFGTTVQGNNPIVNGVFRAERYAAAYPGLAGRQLTGNGVLEMDPSPQPCELNPEPSCPPDLNMNYLVDVGDLLALLSSFGCTTGCEDQDIDGDGAVSVPDLLALLSALGSTCAY